MNLCTELVTQIISLCDASTIFELRKACKTTKYIADKNLKVILKETTNKREKELESLYRISKNQFIDATIWEDHYQYSLNDELVFVDCQTEPYNSLRSQINELCDIHNFGLTEFLQRGIWKYLVNSEYPSETQYKATVILSLLFDKIRLVDLKREWLPIVICAQIICRSCICSYQINSLQIKVDRLKNVLKNLE